MPQWLVGLLLAVAVASAAPDLANVYTIEKDMAVLESSGRSLDAARKMAEQYLAQARQRNDPVAEAGAQTVLNQIGLIQRRSNITAVTRQVDQTKSAFQESEWREFLTSLGTGVAVGRVAPDAIAKIIEKATEAIQNVVTLSAPLPQTSQDVSDYIATGLRVLEKRGPLSTQIGTYLAQSTLAKIAGDNTQIATMARFEQTKFLCDQSRRRLADLLRAERAPARIAIIQEAQKTLEAGCTKAQSTGSRWVLVDNKPIINASNAPLEASGGGHTSKWTVTEEKMTFDTRYFWSGAVLFDQSFSATFTKPPSILVPGQVVTMTASGTGSGTVAEGVAGAGGGPYDYVASGIALKGRTQFGLNKVQTKDDITVTFEVPPVRTGEIAITARSWNCAPCNVTWKYKAE